MKTYCFVKFRGMEEQSRVQQLINEHSAIACCLYVFANRHINSIRKQHSRIAFAFRNSFRVSSLKLAASVPCIPTCIFGNQRRL